MWTHDRPYNIILSGYIRILIRISRIYTSQWSEKGDVWWYAYIITIITHKRARYVTNFIVQNVHGEVNRRRRNNVKRNYIYTLLYCVIYRVILKHNILIYSVSDVIFSMVIVWSATKDEPADFFQNYTITLLDNGDNNECIK
jgi:hypothetical protein